MKRIIKQLPNKVGKGLVVWLALIAIAIATPTDIYALNLRSKVENGMPFTENGGSCSVSTGPTSSTDTPVGGGTTTIPKEGVKIFDSVKSKIEANKAAYEKGGQANKIPWAFIAALHYREASNDPNRSILSGEKLGETNPDNPGNTSHTLDESAVKAGKHVKAMAKSVYGIEIKADGNHSLDELQKIFVAYNRGFLYKRVNASPATSPYAMHYYDAQHINMKWPNGPEEPPVTRGKAESDRLGAIAVYILAGGSLTAGSSCAVGTFTDAYVNPDGYAFPVGLPKFDASNGYARFDGKKAPDPYCPNASCHHDGSAAFDIAHRLTVGKSQDEETTGKPTFAIIKGKIASRKTSYMGLSGCHTLQLFGKDGFYYWYGHIAKTTVKEGQSLEAGQQVAEVGPRRCTGNGSYPHLHIDRGTCGGGVKGEKGITTCRGNASRGGSVGSRDPAFTDTMNRIYKLWPAEASGGDE